MGRHGRARRALVRSGAVMTAVAIGSVTTAVAPTPASAAPPGKNFGPLIDGLAANDQQTQCFGVEQPGVVDFRAMVLAAYPGTTNLGILRGCNVGDRSEHKEGRAWDWGATVAQHSAQINDLLNWLMATDKYGNQYANLRRLGIMYIIWNRQIWSAHLASQGWRPYTGTDPHNTHVHFSFSWAGALRQTSWWAGGSFGKQTVGYYQPSTATYAMRNSQAGGPAEIAFQYGPAGARPIAGDWNADGKTSIGYYQPASGTWHLRNTNGAGGDDAAFQYGPANMVPIAGDWNNDGKTTIGYYNPGNGTFHLRNTNSAGPDDIAFQFGGAGMVPVTGDWNNDGKTGIGFYNPGNGTWTLKDVPSAGPADASFVWNGGSQTPITGDWNADGKTTIGFYNPATSTYQLRNALSGGAADHVFQFGPAGARPITGDWDRA